MKQAVLLVSFGTSVESARQRDILPVEQALRERAPAPCYTAYTSPTIRRILKKRGVDIPGMAQALEQMARDGVTHAFVQPTHLLYGYEYDAMKLIAAEKSCLFTCLELGEPLLAGTEDIQKLAAELSLHFPAEDGTAHLLLGHGTEHFANTVYPAMQTAFCLLGRKDVFVGTAEGWPGYEEVSRELASAKVKKVRLSPLMLVAGDHAHNDMAGAAPDSWKSRLEREGYQVGCDMRGLGSFAGVRALYAAHFDQLLQRGREEG